MKKNIRKILFCFCFLIGIFGCAKKDDASLSGEELMEVNHAIREYFTSNKAAYKDFCFSYVDETKDKVIVALRSNGSEEQERFKQEVLDSDLIDFIAVEDMQYENTESYSVNMPDVDEITKASINTMEQTGNIKEYSDQAIIEDIYDVFHHKTTKMISMNYVPEDPDVEYAVTLENQKGEITLLYVYEKDEKYYFEQAYNGIYEMTLEEFQRIENYTK